MAILTISLLKKIIDNLPDEYDVQCETKQTVVPLEDRVEIDISAKTLTFK